MKEDLKKKKVVPEKADKRKKIKEKTNEEIIMESQLENIENERLKAVFKKLQRYKEFRERREVAEEREEREGVAKSKEKEREKEKEKEKDKDEGVKSFGYEELQLLLTDLKYPWTKHEIERMIWEVDENLDQRVDFYEFELMYKRCVFDETGLEPRNLFNLVQFLMYDKTNRGTITVEDTLELIYVRYGDKLNDMIKQIFDNKETTEDGLQREFTFQEYLTRIRKRDLEIRKALEMERRKVSLPEKKKDD